MDEWKNAINTSLAIGFTFIVVFLGGMAMLLPFMNPWWFGFSFAYILLCPLLTVILQNLYDRILLK